MLESVCMDVRAAVGTVILTAKEPSHATLSISSTLPQTPASAASGRYEFGMTIRVMIWHDNKDKAFSSQTVKPANIWENVFSHPTSSGLSPAWMLQYVLVKDLHTGSSYYFLVDEWLSVDNDKTDGRVEVEVEASGMKLSSNHLQQTSTGGRCQFVHSTVFFPVSFRGGSASPAAPPPAMWAAESAVWKSPVAVAVGATPPQPLHPSAENHLLRCVTAALCTGQQSVVQHCGGQ